MTTHIERGKVYVDSSLRVKKDRHLLPRHINKPPHSLDRLLTKKKLRSMEKWEFSCFDGGNRKWSSCHGKKSTRHSND
jgi:hypothetical protein